MSLVFVYGTLKEGFHNHYVLSGAEYLGTGKTVHKYALYVDGIPFVLKGEAESTISGEVYSVDSETLAKLDRLERHPEWYCREQVDVVIDGDSTEKCWLYFFPVAQGSLVESGNYTF